MDTSPRGRSEYNPKTLVIITDTSVLINFLVADLVPKLVQLSGYEFWITNHVVSEITDHYDTQLDRLTNAITNEQLREISVSALPEVEQFARLTKLGLGVGECSAISVAILRGHYIAIDDKTAIKRLREITSAVDVFTTADLMVLLIQQGVITIPEADQIKYEWEQQYRFKLPFKSFNEKV